MQKVRFLQTVGTFEKDSFRVIMGENQYVYHVQLDLHSLETKAFSKKDNGILYQVVERS